MCSSVWKNLWGVYVLKALIWVLNSVYWTKLQKIRFLERFTLSELRLWGHRVIEVWVIWGCMNKNDLISLDKGRGQETTVKVSDNVSLCPVSRVPVEDKWFGIQDSGKESQIFAFSLVVKDCTLRFVKMQYTFNINSTVITSDRVAMLMLLCSLIQAVFNMRLTRGWNGVC